MTNTEIQDLTLADTTERFEALVDQTGRNAAAFVEECRDLGELIEGLKKTSIFDK